MLAAEVAPIGLARERTLPVSDTFAALFGERGLVRGHTISSQGQAATSAAFGLVAAAVDAGSWLCVVDLPTIGLDAANELGVPLERIVAVDTGGDPDRWPDVVAAGADGFDLILTRVPEAVRAGPLRRVGERIRRRGSVLVVVGDPGPLACDGVVSSGRPEWSGLGDGWGHLAERRVELWASGRRLHGRHRCRASLSVS